MEEEVFGNEGVWKMILPRR